MRKCNDAMATNGAVEITARLEQVDRFASTLMARAPAIRFQLATSVEERQAIFRLRYAVVIERGWVPPETMPNGMEQDTDDDRAVLIGGWDEKGLAAAGRVIFPEPGYRLPVERFFGLAIGPDSRVAHLDRLCVARLQRERSHCAFGALVGRCWHEMRAHGYGACCGIDSAAMTRVFRRLGLTLTPLGPPRRYWGELRSPMLFDPAAISQLSPATPAWERGECDVGSTV